MVDFLQLFCGSGTKHIGTKTIKVDNLLDKVYVSQLALYHCSPDLFWSRSAMVEKSNSDRFTSSFCGSGTKTIKS
jgi:hypothetical protein